VGPRVGLDAVAKRKMPRYSIRIWFQSPGSFSVHKTRSLHLASIINIYKTRLQTSHPSSRIFSKDSDITGSSQGVPIPSIVQLSLSETNLFFFSSTRAGRLYNLPNLLYTGYIVVLLP